MNKWQNVARERSQRAHNAHNKALSSFQERAQNQTRTESVVLAKAWGAIKMAGLVGFILGAAGTASATPVTTMIRLKSKVSMAELAQQILNPNSPRYQKFYTTQEIRQLAAPSDQDYKKELELLKKEGFTIVQESPTHLWVSVRGEASNFEKTFSTSLEMVGPGRHRPKVKATIPERLHLVDAVIGLDNSRQLHPMMKFALNPMRKKKPSPNPDPDPFPFPYPDPDPTPDPFPNPEPTPSPIVNNNGQIPGFSPAQIQKIYGFDKVYAQGLTGAGQHIAIATYNNFNLSDVTSAYSILHLPSTPTVDVISFNGVAPYDANSAGETELDAQMAGMIAPGASIHVFTSVSNDDTGEAQMFTAILDDGRAKIVNYSWGGCEPQLSSQHKEEMITIFQRAVAQGVNIMVAAGDTGSDSCQDGSNKADWPATNDNVVAVGGTSLQVSGDQVSEVGWSGSGGGVSALFAQPSWQNGVTSYNMRAYPDVAFNADPKTGQAIYYSQGANVAPQWVLVGGTSMAAPQWAGFLALVGEARAKAGQTTLGYLNPRIYSAGAQSQNVFYDVTSGSNGLYTAGQGWDAVTGFGSLNAPNMLTFLMSN